MQILDYMLILGSTVLPSNCGSTNFADYFQIATTEPKSEMQIHNDDCHFWCEPNTTTISNLLESITDFCFSIFRYFEDEILDLAIARDDEFLAASSSNVICNTPDSKSADNQQKGTCLL